MKALAYRRFGPPEVMAVTEVDRPHPARGEVLVRVWAAAMNPKDVLVRKGKFALFTGRRFPKVPGYDFAGEVAELGAGVSGLEVGAPVFGMVNRWSAGAAAEFLSVPADELASRPRDLTWAEAAALPLAALTALQALRDLARVRPGKTVLINGASGGVGVYAIQIARILGAEVTTVSSARNLSFCRDLGADHALDYAMDSVDAGRGPFDVIFDVFGNLPFKKARAQLGVRGRYVTTIPKPGTVFDDLSSRWAGQPRRLVVVRSNRADLDRLAAWVEQGKLRPVVDRVLPLDQGAAAHAYIETKRARGKVVLELA